MSAAEDRLGGWLSPLSSLFTRPSWRRVVVLVTGALLTPHRRTVSSALGGTGRGQAKDFTSYHAVLNRNRWSALAVAKVLIGVLVARFAVSGPVVIGMDDTIERRWGAKIKARGIYRDPVRSSHGHFVKASGLRWLSAMLLVPLPWAHGVWTLPFLTVLAPSERSTLESGRRYKAMTDWARQMVLQIARWLRAAASWWSPTAASPPSTCSTRPVARPVWSLGFAWTSGCSRRRSPGSPGRSAGPGARRNACLRSRRGWPIPPRPGHP